MDDTGRVRTSDAAAGPATGEAPHDGGDPRGTSSQPRDAEAGAASPAGDGGGDGRDGGDGGDGRDGGPPPAPARTAPDGQDRAQPAAAAEPVAAGHEQRPVDAAGAAGPAGAAGAAGPAGLTGPAGMAGEGEATGRRWPARLDVGGGWVDGLVCAAAMLAVGPLLGLLWAASAPRLDVAMVLAGSSSELNVQSSIDVYFGFIVAVAGVVGGVVAFWRAADSGWPVPAGLAAGGFGGGLLAGWVGHQVRSPNLLAALPPGIDEIIIGLVDMRVRAPGLYLVYPTVALVVLALLIWVTAVRTHGRP